MARTSSARGNTSELSALSWVVLRKRLAGCAGLAGVLLAAAAILTSCWLFGGVQAAVQVWLGPMVIAALVCCLASRLLSPDAERGLPWAILPALGLLCLAVFQLIPLGDSVLSILSPWAAELRSSLESPAPSSDATLAERLGVPAKPERQPVSLYPAATRRDLAYFTLGASALAVGACASGLPRVHPWLWMLFAANGAAVVLFGLVQRLTWDGLLYWRVPLSMGGSPFGPFVNRNNAGGFLNLSLACALGVAVWSFHSQASSISRAVDGRVQRAKSPLARIGYRLAGFLAELNGRRAFAIILVACLAAGVLCSLSRGAMVALLGGALVTALLAYCAARRLRGVWLAGGVAALGIGLVAWGGQTAAVRSRLATLLEKTILEHKLLEVWRDMMQAVPDFWRLGSGFGTFRFLSELYLRQPHTASYYYAENQYLQTLLEGGVIGLGLLAVLGLLVTAAGWRLIRAGRDRCAFAIGIVAIFALSTQAIQGLFDFGLYLPSNLVLMGLLAGSACGMAARADVKEPTARRSRGAWPLRAVPAVLVVLLAVTVWGLSETRSVAAVEQALKSTRYAEGPLAVSRGEIELGIEKLASACSMREDDAEAHLRLAGLWVRRYRIQQVEQLGRQSLPEKELERRWPLTLPIVLHGQICRLVDEHNRAEVERIRHSGVVQENLPAALTQFLLARRACPLLAKVHLGIAELTVLVAEPGEEQASLERARRLAAADPELFYEAGMVDLQAGRRAAACESWRRSLALSHRFYSNIVAMAEERLSLLELVERVLPDSPPLLLDLASQKKYQAKHYREVRHRLAERALHAVEQGDLTEDDKCRLRASALAVLERYSEAIAQGERAVRLRPREPRWRYELALLLKQQDRLAEAHEHARVCAMLNPSKREYRKLLEDINLARLMVGTRAEGPK